MSEAEAVRSTAVLFSLAERGLIEVRGSDRERWLDGQISNALPSLESRSGCYAFVLTPTGRVVSDVHVLAREESFWLEVDRAAVGPLLARLEKYVIADDVELRNRSAEVVRLALEGPRAGAILAAVLGEAFALEPDTARTLGRAGQEVVVAAYGWSGEDAYQLIVPREASAAVDAALEEAGRSLGLARGSEAVLMGLLRVEAGIPRQGAELDEDVLPAETGQLERAVSFSKGCYIGQEVVARMHSRARVKHHLVGLAWEGETPPLPGVTLERDGNRVGEVTSSACSPQLGAIALGYVVEPHHAAGTSVYVGGRAGRVAALPFVAPRSPEPVLTLS